MLTNIFQWDDRIICIIQNGRQMSKNINIVILYQNNFHKGSKTNVLQTDTLWAYTTSEMGLPGFKGKGQGQ